MQRMRAADRSGRRSSWLHATMKSGLRYTHAIRRTQQPRIHIMSVDRQLLIGLFNSQSSIKCTARYLAGQQSTMRNSQIGHLFIFVAMLSRLEHKRGSPSTTGYMARTVQLRVFVDPIWGSAYIVPPRRHTAVLLPRMLSEMCMAESVLSGQWPVYHTATVTLIGHISCLQSDISQTFSRTVVTHL